MSFESSPNVL